MGRVVCERGGCNVLCMQMMLQRGYVYDITACVTFFLHKNLNAQGGQGHKMLKGALN